MNDEDIKEIRARYRAIIAKMLFEHFPAFEMFEQYTPQVTHCAYAKEMSTRSEFITMPIVMKDEKKYAECFDVLGQLETWTHEIYSAAGLCSREPESSNQSNPVITAHSRPDQPASHVPPVAAKSGPLHGVKMPCYGD